MTISEKDVELIKKFIGIKNRGHYADSKQLTEVYNRVLGKNVQPTTCGQCLRKRVNELETALKKWEKEQEALKNAQESGFTTVEEAERETKKIMEEHKEEVENADKPKPHKTKGGKKVQKQTAR